MRKKTSTEVIADFLAGRHHIGYEDAYEDAEDIPAYLNDAGYYIVDPSKLTLISDEEIVAIIEKEYPVVAPFPKENINSLYKIFLKDQLSHIIKQIQEQGK